MSRKVLKIINSDREIIDLRMQSEDLINNAEFLSEEAFRKEAERIEKELNERMTVLRNSIQAD